MLGRINSAARPHYDIGAAHWSEYVRYPADIGLLRVNDIRVDPGNRIARIITYNQPLRYYMKGGAQSVQQVTSKQYLPNKYINIPQTIYFRIAFHSERLRAIAGQ
jgi:hypothetical protein